MQRGRGGGRGKREDDFNQKMEALKDNPFAADSGKGSIQFNSLFDNSKPIVAKPDQSKQPVAPPKAQPHDDEKFSPAQKRRDEERAPPSRRRDDDYYDEPAPKKPSARRSDFEDAPPRRRDEYEESPPRRGIRSPRDESPPRRPPAGRRSVDDESPPRRREDRYRDERDESPQRRRDEGRRYRDDYDEPPKRERTPPRRSDDVYYPFDLTIEVTVKGTRYRHEVQIPSRNVTFQDLINDFPPSELDETFRTVGARSVQGYKYRNDDAVVPMVLQDRSFLEPRSKTAPLQYMIHFSRLPAGPQ